ncbi:MAG TPA: hypothetical protein VE077_03185 [Candidatus Methylomirabilis sp.]|nr:hypothetical protein [Candidatus Methylomirabilis sp.]
MSPEYILCDGCGQAASPDHLAGRLKRLEWTTRWRPVHIGTLLLGACSPQTDAEFLYAAQFEGEAASALKASSISPAGKTPEAALTEFQRGGYFLAHLLECPPNAESAGRTSMEALILRRIPTVAARIRRSLKPKRIVLISELPLAVLEALAASELGCPLFRNDGTAIVAGPAHRGTSC